MHFLWSILLFQALPLSLTGERMDCALGFDELHNELANFAGINVADRGGWTIYDDGEGRQAFFVTQEGGLAHPAIFRRGVVEVDDQLATQTLACGYGEEAETQAVLQWFAAQDQQLARRFASEN